MNLGNRKLLLPIIVLLVTAFSLGLIASLNVVHAANQHGDDNCPGTGGSTPCISIVPSSKNIPAVGTSFTLNVNFTNMPSFGGWDIAVKTNQAIVKPTAIGNIDPALGSTVSFNCVNGVGSGCTNVDGAGIAHSVVTGLGTSDAGNGTLFSITYLVVSTGSTPVTFINSPAGPSVVTDPTGLTVLDCAVTPNQCLPGSVHPAPDFTVSVTQNSYTQVLNGATITDTVLVTGQNGFTGTVTLSASASPTSGLSTALNTTSVSLDATHTSRGATLTMTASSVGNYVVTVTGSSPGFSTKTATVNVQVVDFTVAANPNPVGPTAAVASGTTTITVTGVNGFAGTVTLSATPFGPSASLSSTSPNPCTLSATVTTCTATLTMSANTANTYTVDVTASSVGATRTVHVTFIVNDFSVTANPIDVGPVATGSDGQSTINVTALNGFTGTVTLSLSHQSAGLTASLSQTVFTFTSTGPKSQTTTLHMSFTQPGTYSVNVDGASSGYPTHSVTVTVFSGAVLYISPPSQPTASPGSALSYQVRVAAFPTFNGWDISIRTDPAILNPTGYDLTGTMLGGATVVGDCVNGVGSNCVVTDGPGVIHLVVVSTGSYAAGDGLLFNIHYVAVQGDFTVSASPNPMGPVAATATASSTITVTAVAATTPITIFNDVISDPSGVDIPHSTTNGSQAVNFIDTVTLSATPFGPSASLSSTSPSPCALNSAGPNTSCTATLTASANLAGTYEIDVTGTGVASGISHTDVVHLIVNDFSVSGPTSIGPLPPNTDGTATITITALNGFHGVVTCSATPSPGLTASLSQSTFDFSTGPTTRTTTLTVRYSTPATYNVTVTCTSPGYPSHSINILVIPPATLFISPPSQPTVAPGSVVTSQVRVVGFPAFNGWDISVRTNSSILNPTSYSLTGSMLADATVVGDCINGVGSFCTASDGPGVVHLVVVSTGSYATGDGLLFSINYVAVQGDFTISASPNPFGPTAATSSGSTTITVTGVNAVTQITIFNDVVSDPSGASIPHNTVNGSQAVSFADTVTLAATPFGPSASLSPTSPNPCTLNAAVTSCTATLTASANLAGTYEIDVTGTGTASTYSHTVVTHFIVNDFSVTGPTSIGPLPPNTDGTATITISALNGFHGVVTCSATPSPGLTASLSQSTFDFSTGPTTRTTTLTVRYSTPATYNVTVTCTSPGYPSHSINILVIPPATLFISPVSQPQAPAGTTTVTYQVRVVGFPTFNGWDISVRTNPAVLTPNGFSLTGSMLADATVVGSCINGSGSGCSPSDGPGVIHLAVVSTGSYATGDGLLFTITYTAVAGPGVSLTANPSSFGPLAPGATATSTITVGNLFGSSVTIFNDVVSDPSGADVPHTTNNGTYGSADSISLTVSAPACVTANISPNSMSFVPSDISKTATLTFSSSCAGNFTITITSTSSHGVVNTTTVSATVTDFRVDASPTTVMPPVGVLTGSSTIMVTGLNGFTGTVTLTVTSSAGLTCNLSTSSIALSATTTSGSSTLTCSATSGGTYTAMVTGTSPGYPNTASHTARVTFIFSQKSFTISCNPNVLHSSNGNVQQLFSVCTIRAVGGFTGTVTLTATVSPSGQFNAYLYPSSVTLDASHSTRQVILYFNKIKPHAAAGTYDVKVTGTSGTQTVSTHVTVIVGASGVTLNSVTWTHTLSLAATGGVQRWTMSVTNTGSTAQYIQGNVQGQTGSGTRPFTASSSVSSLAAGATTTITVTYTFTALDVGQTFYFQALVLSGSSSGSLNNASNTIYGSFNVTA